MEPHAHAVLADVSKLIQESAETVRKQVVDAFANREINDRADTLVKALDKLKTMNRDLDKIKPDQTSYDENGTKVSEFFSKEKTEERKKAKEKIAKLEKALETALSGEPAEKVAESFSTLKNLLNSKDSSPSE